MLGETITLFIQFSTPDNFFSTNFSEWLKLLPIKERIYSNG